LVTMSVSKETPTSFSMEYESFDGYRIYRFELTKTTNVDIRFETISGRLDVLVNKGDEVFYQQDDVRGGFGLSFPKGKYTVRLTGDHHQGSFSFDWTE